MQLSDDRQSRDECLHGRTQLWASATRQLMPLEDADVNRRHQKPRHTPTRSTVTPRESRAGDAGSLTKTSTSFWSTETEASRITEHEDDFEEESTQPDEENSDKLWNNFQQQFGKLYGTHRQVQCQACGASAGVVVEGDQWQQAHLTKTTSTATVVEDEPDEDARMYRRSSQALESR